MDNKNREDWIETFTEAVKLGKSSDTSAATWEYVNDKMAELERDVLKSHRVKMSIEAVERIVGKSND